MGRYLSEWDKVRTADGEMIPLVLAVGNHDVGTDRCNKGADDCNKGTDNCIRGNDD